MGSRDGVHAQETVLNGDGLVGTVTQVSRDTSTVLLATDAALVVGALLAGSNQIGAITGTGKSLSGPYSLQLRLFDGNAVLRAGQSLVTFGSVQDRPFVPGVPIGQVAQVQGNAGSLTQTALIKPFVDFSSLGVVGVVIAGPAQNPRDSVLPPGPKPVPTVTVTVTPWARPSSPPPPPSPPPRRPRAGEMRRLLISIAVVAVALLAQLTFVSRRRCRAGPARISCCSPWSRWRSPAARCPAC